MRFVRGHHNIFVPVYKDIILPSDLRVGVEGHIGVELIDARTKKIKRRLQFKNLVTNAGLNGMASINIKGANNTLTAYCAVGTGTTAPTNADTTLQAELASNSRVQYDASPGPQISYVAGTPDYYKCVIEYDYSETQANGNLTEVGFFNATVAGTMFSRQLFKDELGNPTEVTKTSSDQLRIFYELRVYPPIDDIVLAGQNISGNIVDVTARAIAVGSTRWNTFFDSWPSFASGGSNNRFYSSALISRTSTSFGTATGSTIPSSSSPAYVTDNFYRDVTVKHEPSAGNCSILCYQFCGSPQIIFGIGFSSAITKTDTQRFTLNYRTSWARHV